MYHNFNRKLHKTILIGILLGCFTKKLCDVFWYKKRTALAPEADESYSADFGALVGCQLVLVVGFQVREGENLRTPKQIITDKSQYHISTQLEHIKTQLTLYKNITEVKTTHLCFH